MRHIERMLTWHPHPHRCQDPLGTCIITNCLALCIQGYISCDGLDRVMGLLLPRTCGILRACLKHINLNISRGASDRSLTPEGRLHSRLVDVETVVAQSLRAENDLLRCQLNDLITRERTQRLELQKLRQYCDDEVATRVQSGTSKLKGEVDQLKSMLHGTSSQLLQVLGEKEQAKNQQEEIMNVLEQEKLSTVSEKNVLAERIRCLEDTLSKSVGLVGTIADSVEAFQHHVLPTFKPCGFEIEKSSFKDLPENEVAKKLMQQLLILENGLTLLRVIVDAKNDTLVMIRGKSHHNVEVNDLKAKLKTYEMKEQQGQDHLLEAQKDLSTLQDKFNSAEVVRSFVEGRLKEETLARSQLLSELLNLRKDHEKSKTELEILKFNQKFLVRQPRNGRIPAEKMDLMNTVNQLLGEVNKIKTEKVILEEKLKANQRSQLLERLTGVTDRDIHLAASNRVGDSELASRLARQRIQQLNNGQC